MKKLFSKRSRRVERESAPTLTTYQRQALAAQGLPPGEISYETYAAMERDSMVQTALTIKRLAVVAADYTIESANSSPEASRNAEFVAESFELMDGSPLTILNQAMGAFASGASIQELVFEPTRTHAKLVAVRPKDPSLFGFEFDEFGRLEHLSLRLPGTNERRIPRSKFAIYFNRASYRHPKGQSDLDAAHRHWLAKQALLNAWKLHLERYASPTVLAKYQRGLPQAEQSSILSALETLHQNTAIVFPNEIELSTLGGQRDAISGFLDAMEFHNREMARSILGQTLTTDEGRRVGSLALGKVHLQVMLLQIAAIRKELADAVMTEQIIRPMIELNFGPGNIPRFRFEATRPEAFITGIVD
ncbi:MAG: DUF935 family protein [Chthonomonas sp.]|nr:DUF935 family protein [Chthonomonas sp.]